MSPELLRTAMRTILKRFAKRIYFAGDARHICTEIVEKVWNGNFYQTGLVHFDYFWIRDFGTVTGALVQCGHRERVHETLRWALFRYMKANTITTCISKKGICFNAPIPAIDSLPWLLHAVVESGYEMSATDRAFVDGEIQKFCSRFLYSETGRIKKRNDYAELRDATRYTKSAYAVTMVALLARSADRLGLETPILSFARYQKVLLEEYWNGSYFNADCDNTHLSVEGTLFPFWLGIIEDTDKLNSVLAVLESKHMSAVCPLQYTDTPDAFLYRWWTKWGMPNYAGSTIWSWHGAIYLQLLARVQHEQFFEKYQLFRSMIERHGTFPELLNSDGTWYKTSFYQTEAAMIWAVLFLVIEAEATAIVV